MRVFVCIDSRAGLYACQRCGAMAQPHAGYVVMAVGFTLVAIGVVMFLFRPWR